MAARALNSNLQDAKKAKEDEFYTQLNDIERELKHYKEHFRDKVVYCNCDDPRVSNFFHYFAYKFEQWGLSKLVTTCYKNQQADLFSQNDSEHAIYLEYDGDENGNNVPDPDEIAVKPLKGDGDFRSGEAIALLQQADIVVTNPPFSIFREFVTQMVAHDKKFLVIGNQNAITYKEIFSLIQSDKVWLGVNSGDMAFRVPDYYEPRETRFWVDDEGQKWRSMGNACWFTNLDLSKRHEDLILYRTYNPDDYPTYANYEGIEVGRTADIPMDYDGAMGVPITFLSQYNPEQFEILGNSRELGTSMASIAGKGTYAQGGPRFYLPNGDGTYRRMYDRIAICQFVQGDFAFEKRYFHNLEKDEKEQVLSYPLTVYLCSGTDSEKLDWFETINIAGLELTKQELRNAVYAGPWVTEAKRHFSKRNAPAIGLGGDYMSGAPNRQLYLGFSSSFGGEFIGGEAGS